jgi:hypothetical protein
MMLASSSCLVLLVYAARLDHTDMNVNRKSALHTAPSQLQTYQSLIRIYKQTGDMRMARHYENLYKVIHYLSRNKARLHVPHFVSYFSEACASYSGWGGRDA